jgi:hypothetical protein
MQRWRVILISCLSTSFLYSLLLHIRRGMGGLANYKKNKGANSNVGKPNLYYWMTLLSACTGAKARQFWAMCSHCGVHVDLMSPHLKCPPLRSLSLAPSVLPPSLSPSPLRQSSLELFLPLSEGRERNAFTSRRWSHWRFSNASFTLCTCEVERYFLALRYLLYSFNKSIPKFWNQGIYVIFFW